MTVALLTSIPALASTLGYVPTNDGSGVWVIDTSTNTLVANIPTGQNGGEMAFTPDGKFAYMTSPATEAGAIANIVTVISTATNSVTGTITVGQIPEGLAVTPNGQFVYVVNSYWDSVWVIATSTNTVVATIPVGHGPLQIVITQDGAYAYVSNGLSNTVSVIDTTTNTIVSTISVGSGPEHLAISPDGNFVYVSDYSGSSVSVIDTASKTVANTIEVTTQPRGIVTTPDGRFVYVAVGTYYTGYSISVIDTTSDAVAATVPETLDAGPRAELAITPDGAYIYVSNSAAPSVSVIATATNTIVDTIPVGSVSGAVVFTPQANAEVSLFSLSLNPSSITGGSSSRGTVVLTGAAPVGGVSVSLSSNDSSAIVPASVTVAAGSKTATFPVTAASVANPTLVTLTASYKGLSKTQQLSIAPAAQVLLSSVSVNPTSVMSGTSASGTVTLSAAAPAGGTVVSLWTNGSPAFVPESITIPAGSTIGSFPVTTIYTSSDSQSTITAFYNGLTKTATLTVTAPVTVSLSSVSVNPTSVMGGTSASGTVTLSAAAPAGGTVVSLWTNGSPAFVPASITIPAGSTIGSFPVTTIYTSSASQSTITAFYNGLSKTAILTITPAAMISLSSVSVTPTSITGGASVTGTVTLSAAAPAGGIVVYLWTNGSPAFVPTSVTIPAGSSMGSFPVTTIYTSSALPSTITAFYNGTSKMALLTVTP